MLHGARAGVSKLMTSPLPFAPFTRWRWIAVFWSVGAVFEATQSVFILHAQGKHGGEALLFVTELAAWLPWALATPFVIDLARRRPIIPVPTARGVAAHLMALLAITVIAEAWSAGVQMLFNPWAHREAPAFWDTWSVTLVFHGLICVFAYALILAITYLVDSRDKVARQATETARLNEELSKAQLAALRRQTEPHFMFNTLNSIAALVRDDRKAAAVSMIVGLSEFLRRASDDAHRPQVTLAEEVEYLQRYIDIQKVRFGERLQFSATIAPDLLDAQVPNLLLQPLVENAIKYGLSERAGGGAIRVIGEKRGTNLRLSVYNDGPGFSQDWQAKGSGLVNLRTRLQILYGDAAEFRMDNVRNEGVEVVVTFPLTRA
jgi:two-component system, LytTR family, sensor kinase